MLYVVTNLGSNAGAHRLWSHRSYKARLPLRIFLMIGQTLTLQRSVMTWARDHRIHHKHSDTTKDPHNSNRGFFFSHVGWLFLPKSAEVLSAEKEIYMTDLINDSVVKFQDDYYPILTAVMSIFLPTIIPMYLWHETFSISMNLCVWLRAAVVMNSAFSVNSFAHLYGNKPYDQ